MGYALIAVVATAMVAVASTFVSRQYYRVKAKASIETASIMARLFEESVKALKDDTLTEDEVAKIAALVKKLVVE